MSKNGYLLHHDRRKVAYKKTTMSDSEFHLYPRLFVRKSAFIHPQDIKCKASSCSALALPLPAGQ